MPNIKISQMPLAESLDGSEEIPIVQEGANKKTTAAALSQAVLSQDLTVNVGAGAAVGGSQTGELFPKGATLESVLRDILIKAVHPTYVQPVVTITTTDNGFFKEAGSIINPTFSYSFTQNDGGSLNSLSFKKNGTEISTVMPYTATNLQIVDNNTTFNLTANYDQGLIKNDNLGNLDATGRINAGSVNSNSIIYTGQRKFFWGTSNAAPGTSNDVRNLSTGNVLSNGSNNEFVITIPQDSVTVWFAYPDTIADVLSVQYVEYSFSEVKPLFTKTIVSVEGANGYSPINYKVFAFTPLQPFQTTIHYKVLLSV